MWPMAWCQDRVSANDALMWRVAEGGGANAAYYVEGTICWDHIAPLY